jgi:hypothetical protein
MRISIILVFITSYVSGNPVWIGSYSDSNGVKLKWEAQPEQFDATTAWSGIGLCPFDIPKLTELAFLYAKNNSEKSEKLRVDSISIQRADRVGEVVSLKDKWYITISFGGSSGSFPGSVRILPDGTIIEPKPKK